ILIKQRQVPVRSGGGEYLDVPRPGAIGEGFGNVPAKGVELFQQLRVEIAPSVRQVLDVAVAGPLEILTIAACPINAILEVFLEAGLEMLVGELLQQHRRQPDRDLRRG